MRRAELHALTSDMEEEEIATEDGVVLLQTLRIFDPGSPNSADTAAGQELEDKLQRASLEDERHGKPPRGVVNSLSRLTPVPHSFSMTWDEVCSKFATLNLNWNPALVPTTAERHWYVISVELADPRSWPKPGGQDGDSAEWLSLRTSPKFRVEATVPPGSGGGELWLLLSQHVQDKNVPLDDVALHVFRDFRHGNKSASMQPVLPEACQVCTLC